MMDTHPFIVVATTHKEEDKAIVDYCLDNAIEVFKGNENDVLARFYETGKYYQADAIVRITADCPLIDPKVTSEVIEHFTYHYPKYDYVSNVIPKRTYPKGLDTEVFKFSSLERAYLETSLPFDREHVTPYFYQNPDIINLSGVCLKHNYAGYNISVDTYQDFKKVKEIFEYFHPLQPDFNDVVVFLNSKKN